MWAVTCNECLAAGFSKVATDLSSARGLLQISLQKAVNARHLQHQRQGLWGSGGSVGLKPGLEFEYFFEVSRLNVVKVLSVYSCDTDLLAASATGYHLPKGVPACLFACVLCSLNHLGGRAKCHLHKGTAFAVAWCLYHKQSYLSITNDTFFCKIALFPLLLLRFLP